jgi:hypothetical protein
MIKKLSASLIALTLTLSASDAKPEINEKLDGYKIYEQNCKQCHIEMISKPETMKIFRTLKAPPMVEVSRQLKDNIIIKEDDEEIHRFTVISFIKSYLYDPSIDYSMCNPGAIDNFGIMPTQKHLSEKERHAVAEWIFDRYEGIDFK